MEEAILYIVAAIVHPADIQACDGVPLVAA